MSHFQTIQDRSECVKETWYNADWEYKEMWYYAAEHKIINRPNKLGEMLDLAEQLAQPFPYVRIDLYDTPDKIYFGECTFRPYGGFMRWNQGKWDYLLGNLIDLSSIEK